jgi:hypothetical protein
MLFALLPSPPLIQAGSIEASWAELLLDGVRPPDLLRTLFNGDVH